MNQLEIGTKDLPAFNIKNLLAKFDLLTDSRGAISKLRDVILALAVEGMLVRQRSDAESAENRFSALAAKKHAMETKEGIRKRKEVPIPSREIWPADFPDHWILPSFDLATIVVSGVTKGRKFAGRKTQSVPYLRVANVQRWRLDLEIVKDIQVLEEDVKKYALEPADVLMTEGGDWDKVGRAAIWDGQIENCIHQNHVYRVRSVDESLLLPNWIMLIANSPVGRRYFEGASKQTTNLASINMTQLRSCPMPLPPIQEQQAIVAKVDELMGLCDRLEAEQAERQTRHAALSRAALARFADEPTVENLRFLFHESFDVSTDGIRKAILSLGMRGQLVPQESQEGTGQELLVKVNGQRDQLACEEGIRLPKKRPPVANSDMPYDLPESWMWERIGNLASHVEYGTSQKADGDSSKVPVYRMGNIVDGKLSSENMKYVPANIDDLPRLFLHTNDLLFNRTNSYELVGKTGIFKGPSEKSTFASYLIRIRFPESVLLPEFFNLAMNAPYFRETQIEPEIVQQCGQANFNGTKLSNTVVPVPPLKEQERIVEKINQLMNFVDNLEQQLTESQSKAEQLMEAVVAELVRPN